MRGGRPGLGFRVRILEGTGGKAKTKTTCACVRVRVCVCVCVCVCVMMMMMMIMTIMMITYCTRMLTMKMIFGILHTYVCLQ